MCYKLRWGIYLDSGRWILLSPVLLFLKKKKKKKQCWSYYKRKKDKNIMNFKPTVWLLLFQKEESPEMGIKANIKCPPQGVGSAQPASHGGADLVPWGKGVVTALCFLCLLFSEKLSSEQATEMENMKSLVYRLFTALHLEEFQKKREHHLLEEIDHLKGQLQPLEQVWKRLSWVCL